VGKFGAEREFNCSRQSARRNGEWLGENEDGGLIFLWFYHFVDRSPNAFDAIVVNCELDLELPVSTNNKFHSDAANCDDSNHKRLSPLKSRLNICATMLIQDFSPLLEAFFFRKCYRCISECLRTSITSDVLAALSATLLLYVMANVTTLILGLSQKPDEAISAFPFMSSLSQSVCISEVLRVIEVVEGRGSVSLAG
jgi:hypothetical protein